MSVGVESLFTSALGLVAPWEVAKVELDTARRRIDFEVICNAKKLAQSGRYTTGCRTGFARTPRSASLR